MQPDGGAAYETCARCRSYFTRTLPNANLTEAQPTSYEAVVHTARNLFFGNTLAVGERTFTIACSHADMPDYLSIYMTSQQRNTF